MIKSICSVFLLTFVLPASATVKVNQLKCSGLGLVSGYTTITSVGVNRVSISSVKYFVTTEDDNVVIANAQILPNGFVQLGLYSKKFNSEFSLVLSGPTGPGQFITTAGSDTLDCASNIEAL